jgi:hypothetical protein
MRHKIFWLCSDIEPTIAKYITLPLVLPKKRAISILLLKTTDDSQNLDRILDLVY